MRDSPAISLSGIEDRIANFMMQILDGRFARHIMNPHGRMPCCLHDAYSRQQIYLPSSLIHIGTFMMYIGDFRRISKPKVKKKRNNEPIAIIRNI